MLSSGSSSTDSEVDASVKRGTALASKRKDAFELPQGAVLVNDSDDGAGAIGTEEFDWNSIKDDKNIELWLVRVPDSVCPFLRFSPFILRFGLATSSGPCPPLAIPRDLCR